MFIANFVHNKDVVFSQVTINDVTRRLLSEKDRQLELAREREQALARECNKYRETIQQLTDPDTNDYDALLKTQVHILTLCWGHHGLQGPL